MEFDDMPEPYEDDLEEFERNQLVGDREHEDLADELAAEEEFEDRED
jgi:hypothetical protein